MKTKPSTTTIGIDLGDRKHAVCELDAKGNIIKEETISNHYSKPITASLAFKQKFALPR